MDRLVFTAAATIREQGVARQALVNELANVSTIGFKSSFDVALKSVKVEGPGFDTRFQAQTVSRDLVRLKPGAIMITGNKLDIAMAGASVLTVQAANGDLAFTRRGDLRINSQGRLENGVGQLVMGQNGPIAIPVGFDVRINPDGAVFARDPAAGPAAVATEIDRLRLLDASQVELSRREDGLYQVANQPPGTMFTSGPNLPAIIPNAVEGSNVSAVEAMTRLIDQSRSFEAQVNILKNTKTLDESGSTMIKMG
jgi:flagellar basal-body rod protein FlgF